MCAARRGGEGGWKAPRLAIDRRARALQLKLRRAPAEAARARTLEGGGTSPPRGARRESEPALSRRTSASAASRPRRRRWRPKGAVTSATALNLTDQRCRAPWRAHVGYGVGSRQGSAPRRGARIGAQGGRDRRARCRLPSHRRAGDCTATAISDASPARGAAALARAHAGRAVGELATSKVDERRFRRRRHARRCAIAPCAASASTTADLYRIHAPFVPARRR